MPTHNLLITEKEIELLANLTLAMRTEDPNKKYMASKALEKIGISTFKAIIMLCNSDISRMVAEEICKRKETP